MRSRDARLWHTPLFLLLTLLSGCPASQPNASNDSGGSSSNERGSARSEKNAQSEEHGDTAVSLSPEERRTLEVEFPVPDAGDIRSEVTGFQNLIRCRMRLEGLVAPAVGGVLSDLNYGAITHDACRTLEALASKQIEACDHLQIRATKMGCRRRYAMYHGAPDLCPLELAGEQRDPSCVAVAMRDPSMCYAVFDRQSRGICRAKILRSSRPCRVAHETEREADLCVAAAKRWWQVIPPNRQRSKLPVDFESTLQLCQAEVALPLLPDADVPRPISSAVDGGISECSDSSYLVRSGAIIDGQGLIIAGGRHDSPIGDPLDLVELRFHPPEGKLPATLSIEQGQVEAWFAPASRSLIPPGTKLSQGELRLDRCGSKRGDIIAGVFCLDTSDVDEAATWTCGELETFVRDRLPATRAESSGDSIIQ